MGMQGPDDRPAPASADLPGAKDRVRQILPSWSADGQEDRRMRPSKFSDDQIIQALREVKNGTSAAQVCRKLGITQTTFYRWREKFGGVSVSESRELRDLREENQNLKEIVADLLLDKQAATGLRAKK
jgi:putative transposase